MLGIERSASTGSPSARSASAITGMRSCPRCERSNASVEVAKRVCTTERSSANASENMSVASAAAATSAPPVITEVRRPARSPSSRTTSEVVPLRLIASMRS